MNPIQLTLLTPDQNTLYAQIWYPQIDCKAVIVLIHGLGEHSSRYTRFAHDLNQKHYLVAAIDLRGHGRSTGKRGHSPHYSTLMTDLELFLNTIYQRYPKLPCFLYGHSFGGNLVLNWTLRHIGPLVKGIIATGPALQLATQPPRWKVNFARSLYYLLPSYSLSNGIHPDQLSRDLQVIQNLRADPLVHNQISVRLAWDLIETGQWALERAAQFSKPLLLMQGGADQIVSVQANEEFARRVGKRATFRLWEGLYHEIHQEPEREQVIDYLVNWLDSQLPS